MADDLYCNPAPWFVVDGWERVCIEAAAGFNPQPVVRREPRQAPADVRAEREARLARMSGRTLPWRVAR